MFKNFFKKNQPPQPEDDSHEDSEWEEIPPLDSEDLKISNLDEGIQEIDEDDIPTFDESLENMNQYGMGQGEFGSLPPLDSAPLGDLPPLDSAPLGDLPPLDSAPLGDLPPLD
ncbi:MAG: hypothetical protein D6785_02175, partial [Planctomycetota bacterium]